MIFFINSLTTLLLSKFLPDSIRTRMKHLAYGWKRGPQTLKLRVSNSKINDIDKR